MFGNLSIYPGDPVDRKVFKVSFIKTSILPRKQRRRGRERVTTRSVIHHSSTFPSELKMWQHSSAAQMTHCCAKKEICYTGRQTPAAAQRELTAWHLRRRPIHKPSTYLADLALLALCSGLSSRRPPLLLVLGPDRQLTVERRGAVTWPEVPLPGHEALWGGRSDGVGDGEGSVHRLGAHHRWLPQLGSHTNYRHCTSRPIKLRAVVVGERKLKKKKKKKKIRGNLEGFSSEGARATENLQLPVGVRGKQLLSFCGLQQAQLPETERASPSSCALPSPSPPTCSRAPSPSLLALSEMHHRVRDSRARKGVGGAKLLWKVQQPLSGETDHTVCVNFFLKKKKKGGRVTERMTRMCRTALYCRKHLCLLNCFAFFMLPPPTFVAFEGSSCDKPTQSTARF